MAESQHTHSPAPRALCPVCGRFPERATPSEDRDGIRAVLYLCPAGHQWHTKWTEAAA